MNKSILIVALLGDPTIMPGYRHAGGFNKTLAELIEYLATLEIDCNIITNTNEYTRAGEKKINTKITLYRMHIDVELIVNQDLLYEQSDILLTRIEKILQENNCIPALIHSFYWISGVLAQKLGSKYSVPFIHTPISLSAEKRRTGTPVNSKYQYNAELNFLKHAEFILSISMEETKLLESFYSIKKEKIVIVGRSVSRVFHYPAHTPQGIPFFEKLNPVFNPELYSFNNSNHWWIKGAFTFVGRIVPIKGIIHIINAWIHLFEKYGIDTPPLWIIGGDTIAIQSIRSQINKPDVLESCEKQLKIIWWGVLDSAGISTLLLRTYVLVSHSKFEAGGRMILEAMCQEKPVIATPTGFAANIIYNGYNGYITEFGDELSLYKYMEYFVKQPYLSNSMGKLAKHTYSQYEKLFNYFLIHKCIYQHYIDRIPFQNSLASYIKLLLNRPDFIDIFPYNDIGFTDEEISSIWHSDKNFDNDTITSNDTITRCGDTHFYIWNVQEKSNYFIKQFCNIINFRVLWSLGKEEQAIHASTLYEKAIFSLEFPHILSCLSLYPDYCMYIAPQMEAVSIEELFSEKFSDLMQQFSSFTQTKEAVKYCNLYHGFSPSNLDTAFEELLHCSLQDRELHMLEHLCTWMKANPSLYCKKGLSYGKSLLHHVLKNNDSIFLLPTTTWFWGNLGLDYALTILDIYTSKVCSIETLENILSKISFIPSTQILLWMFYCILLKKYYRYTPGIPECSIDSLDSIFKLLGIAYH